MQSSVAHFGFYSQSYISRSLCQAQQIRSETPLAGIIILVSLVHSILLAFGPHKGTIIEVLVHKNIPRRLSAATLWHLGKAEVHCLCQFFRQPIDERQLCAMLLLLRSTRIRGFVELLVDLLPVQHHRYSVANLSVLQP